MSYSNGLLQPNNNNITSVKGEKGPPGPPGPPGIGFKLVGPDYDMDEKKIFRLKTQPDVKIDADYDSYVLDMKSGVNKEYLKLNCLTKDDAGNNFDANQSVIHNTEPYYDGLYQKTSLVSKEYVDLMDTNLEQKIQNKADLSTNNEQTFNSIINVPNFDPGYSNMSDVMNKGYIDGQDLKKADKTDVLLRNGVNKMSAPLDMNNQYINNLSTPSTHLHGANKAYVDLTALSVLGENKMLSNLDMNKNKIINCSDPTSDNDIVTKTYMESYVSTSHIQSSNRNNVFKYIMDDPAGELTEEDDIKLGDIVTYQASPHQINKNVVDMKLLLDQLGKGYYSSRVGVNLFTLENSNYTLCFELLWSDGNIDPGTVYVNGVSSIETIHNTSKKIFESQKYARLICQFDKSQNIGNNYLMIDIVMKMESGAPYTPNLQTCVVIYGVTGYQSDVQPNVYDLIYYVDNGKVVFNEEIDMNTHAIKGILEGTNDDQAVNYKQLNSSNDNLKAYLETKILSLQPKSYFNTIFEYFFDLLDPSNFIMSDTYGAVVSGLIGNLVFNPTKFFADFEPNKGFMTDF